MVPGSPQITSNAESPGLRAGEPGFCSQLPCSFLAHLWTSLALSLPQFSTSIKGVTQLYAPPPITKLSEEPNWVVDMQNLWHLWHYLHRWNRTLIFGVHSHPLKQLDIHNFAIRSTLGFQSILLKMQPLIVWCVCLAYGNTIPQSWSKTGSVLFCLLCQASLSDVLSWPVTVPTFNCSRSPLPPHPQCWDGRKMPIQKVKSMTIGHP